MSFVLIVLLASQTPCGVIWSVVSNEYTHPTLCWTAPRKLDSQPLASENHQLQTPLEPTLVADAASNPWLTCRHIARKRAPCPFRKVLSCITVQAP